ncbi:MAG: hypothetical protein CR991_11795 [Proteobacteria bacterium]|nr:MAG: hypothetical protein CR991_11795 [Pseudomonadota bacterium]
MKSDKPSKKCKKEPAKQVESDKPAKQATPSNSSTPSNSPLSGGGQKASDVISYVNADNPILVNRDGAVVRSPYELVWDMLKDNARHENDGISIKEISLKYSHIKYDTAKAWLKALVLAGYVKQIVVGRCGYNNRMTIHRYQLIKDCGQTPPNIDSKGKPKAMLAVDAMWKCLRILKTFTANQVVASASTPELVLKLSNVKQYLKMLYRAGYLRLVRAGKAKVQATYQLIHDTGSKAPKIKRGQKVFDQNMQVLVYDPKTPLPASHRVDGAGSVDSIKKIGGGL